MTEKFTQGPWKYMRASRQNSGRIATVGRVGEYVVGPDHGSPEKADYSDHGSDEDDARLIAAAPELLEACRKAEEWLGGWASADPYIVVIRAAIAKATGSAT